MKKLFSVLLVFCMIFMLIPASADAEPERVMDSFDAALNAPGSEIDFENDGWRPWLLCEDAAGNADAAVCSDLADIHDAETGINFVLTAEAGSRLSFDIKCSTESEYDELVLYDYDSNTAVLSRSGEFDWRNVTYTITESGEHNFALIYMKDSSVSEGEDRVWLDNVALLPMDPNAPTLNSVMNASGCDNDYIAVDGSWVVDSFDGRDCAKSNIEYIDDGVATLYTECYLEDGASVLFDYATSSEEDFDYLYLSIVNLDNGSEYSQVFYASGEISWSTGAWSAPEAGNYRLVFTYEKDGSASDGNDAVYLANCYIPSVILGDVVWSTSFEDANPFYCGWTAIDADGDGFTFEWTRDFECFLYGHSVSADGRANMASASYDDAYGDPLSPDNYLVSPAITVSTDNTCAALRFRARSQDDEAYLEHFQVLASTDPADFSNADVLFETNTVHDWTTYTCDLAEYIGSTIYIAFRHFDTVDMYYLNIDALELIADGTIAVAENTPQYPVNEAACEALNVDGGQLSFYSGPKFPWNSVEAGGRTAACSSNHLPLSKGYVASHISLDAPGRLSFDWMNSSEAGFDYLTLYINGEVALEMRSVNGDFENAIVDIPAAGEYDVAWVYSKDDEIAEFNDCSYLDNVAILEAVHPVSFETEDFIGIHAGEEHHISYTLLPEDTTVKTIEWSSSDESVATVDENGVITGVAVGSAVITGMTLDGGIEDTVRVTVMAPLPEQTIYGYRYISSTGGRFDLISFSDANPEEYESLVSFANSPYIFSTVEYVDGKLYGACGCRIFSMDFGTSDMTMIHDEVQDGVEIMDMTYSYFDNSMYLLLSSSSQSAIYIMDLETGSSTLRAAISGVSLPMNTLAISSDGRAYCTQMYTDSFYSIDLETGAATLIGGLGSISSKYQSMTFDHNTGRLLLSTFSAQSGTSARLDRLYVVDPDTATLSLLGDLCGANETQLVGMFTIPSGDMQSFTVDYVSSVTGEVLVSETVERGSILTQFPDIAAPDGYVLSGWSYDGSPITGNTSIFAFFALRGDTNSDGVLTAGDAVLLMRHCIGAVQLDEAVLNLCDMNSDGGVDLIDALALLRTALGIN